MTHSQWFRLRPEPRALWQAPSPNKWYILHQVSYRYAPRTVINFDAVMSVSLFPGDTAPADYVVYARRLVSRWATDTSSLERKSQSKCSLTIGEE